MATRKRKPKKSGNPARLAAPVAPAPPAELVFDTIGRAEIDRILREQLGMPLPTLLERTSVAHVQSFVDALEAEEVAVEAVREAEVEADIEQGAEELPELEPTVELKVTKADLEQQRRIAQVDKALVGAARAAVVDLERRAVRAEKELERGARRVEQAEQEAARHARRADERVQEAQRLRGEAERVQVELDATEREVVRLRAELAEARARADAPAAPSTPADGATADHVEALQAEVAERTALLEDAHRERERLEVALDAARAENSRMRHESRRDAGDEEASEEEPLPSVESVAEALEVARERCTHLVFTERAAQTAADSPFWRPDMILADLVKLDRVAEAYLRPEGIGRPIAQLAQELGLDWRSGVGEVWYGIHPNDYHFSHEGHVLRVAEHVRVANGSGAQRCARIYCSFHPGPTSEAPLPRGIYVGPVGRKLPDSTTG